jgi:hypothetical protein
MPRPEPNLSPGGEPGQGVDELLGPSWTVVPGKPEQGGFRGYREIVVSRLDERDSGMLTRAMFVVAAKPRRTRNQGLMYRRCTSAAGAEPLRPPPATRRSRCDRSEAGTRRSARGVARDRDEQVLPPTAQGRGLGRREHDPREEVGDVLEGRDCVRALLAAAPGDDSTSPPASSASAASDDIGGELYTIAGPRSRVGSSHPHVATAAYPRSEASRLMLATHTADERRTRETSLTARSLRPDNAVDARWPGTPRARPERAHPENRRDARIPREASGGR